MPLKLISGAIAILLLSSVSMGQDATHRSQDRELTQQEMLKLHNNAKIKPPSGAGFYIAPITETPGRFSMLLSDSTGKAVADSFRLAQLEVFVAIMEEAKKFAQTDESVGVKKPITTRFFDRKEPSFMVDVLKLGNQSQFFITIKSLTDRLTMDAGTIKRGDPKSKPLFYDILTRIQEVKSAR